MDDRGPRRHRGGRRHGLITQLERLGNDTTPAADAMRQRITDQFTARYDEAKTLQAELDQIEAAQPAQDDPALLDELPYAATAFTTAPENVKAKIYAAFDIRVLYRAPSSRPPSGQASPRLHPPSSPP
jgi:hypothetical protein